MNNRKSTIETKSRVSVSVNKEKVFLKSRKEKATISAKDAESMKKGLAQLVLQLLNLLRQLMERQAVKRMSSLPLKKQEELGLHLMLLKEKIEEMKEYFGIEKDQLELGLLEGLEDLANDSIRKITYGISEQEPVTTGHQTLVKV